MEYTSRENRRLYKIGLKSTYIIVIFVVLIQCFYPVDSQGFRNRGFRPPYNVQRAGHQNRQFPGNRRTQNVPAFRNNQFQQQRGGRPHVRQNFATSRGRDFGQNARELRHQNSRAPANFQNNNIVNQRNFINRQQSANNNMVHSRTNSFSRGRQFNSVNNQNNNNLLHSRQNNVQPHGINNFQNPRTAVQSQRQDFSRNRNNFIAQNNVRNVNTVTSGLHSRPTVQTNRISSSARPLPVGGNSGFRPGISARKPASPSQVSPQASHSAATAGSFRPGVSARRLPGPVPLVSNTQTSVQKQAPVPQVAATSSGPTVATNAVAETTSSISASTPRRRLILVKGPDGKFRIIRGPEPTAEVAPSQNPTAGVPPHNVPAISGVQTQPLPALPVVSVAAPTNPSPVVVSVHDATQGIIPQVAPVVPVVPELVPVPRASVQNIPAVAPLLAPVTSLVGPQMGGAIGLPGGFNAGLHGLGALGMGAGMLHHQGMMGMHAQLAQFGHPSALSPMYQELLYGDTVDPPDPTDPPSAPSTDSPNPVTKETNTGKNKKGRKGRNRPKGKKGGKGKAKKAKAKQQEIELEDLPPTTTVAYEDFFTTEFSTEMTSSAVVQTTPFTSPDLVQTLAEKLIAYFKSSNPIDAGSITNKSISDALAATNTPEVEPLKSPNRTVHSHPIASTPVDSPKQGLALSPPSISPAVDIPQARETISPQAVPAMAIRVPEVAPVIPETHALPATVSPHILVPAVPEKSIYKPSVPNNRPVLFNAPRAPVHVTQGPAQPAPRPFFMRPLHMLRKPPVISVNVEKVPLPNADTNMGTLSVSMQVQEGTRPHQQLKTIPRPPQGMAPRRPPRPPPVRENIPEPHNVRQHVPIRPELQPVAQSQSKAVYPIIAPAPRPAIQPMPQADIHVHMPEVRNPAAAAIPQPPQSKQPSQHYLPEQQRANTVNIQPALPKYTAVLSQQTAARLAPAPQARVIPPPQANSGAQIHRISPVTAEKMIYPPMHDTNSVPSSGKGDLIPRADVLQVSTSEIKRTLAPPGLVEQVIKISAQTDGVPIIRNAEKLVTPAVKPVKGKAVSPDLLNAAPFLSSNDLGGIKIQKIETSPTGKPEVGGVMDLLAGLRDLLSQHNLPTTLAATVALTSRSTTLPPTTKQKTIATTTSACTPSSPNFRCRGRDLFVSLESMSAWCTGMCLKDGCVDSVCDCGCDVIVTTTTEPTTTSTTAAPSSEKRKPGAAARRKFGPQQGGKRKQGSRHQGNRKNAAGPQSAPGRRRMRGPGGRRWRRPQRVRTTTTPEPTTVVTTEEPPEEEEVEYEAEDGTTTMTPSSTTAVYYYDDYYIETTPTDTVLPNADFKLNSLDHHSSQVRKVATHTEKMQNVAWGSKSSRLTRLSEATVDNKSFSGWGGPSHTTPPTNFQLTTADVRRPDWGGTKWELPPQPTRAPPPPQSVNSWRRRPLRKKWSRGERFGSINELGISNTNGWHQPSNYGGWGQQHNDNNWGGNHGRMDSRFSRLRFRWNNAKSSGGEEEAADR